MPSSADARTAAALEANLFHRLIQLHMHTFTFTFSFTFTFTFAFTCTFTPSACPVAWVQEHERRHWRDGMCQGPQGRRGENFVTPIRYDL